MKRGGPVGIMKFFTSQSSAKSDIRCLDERSQANDSHRRAPWPADKERRHSHHDPDAAALVQQVRRENEEHRLLLESISARE